MIRQIEKRDGRTVSFTMDKIESAILKAFQASGSSKGQDTAKEMAKLVVLEIEKDESIGIPSVEQVQDTVEQVLIANGFVRTAKAYILYRAERSRVREMKSRLMQTLEDITYKDASESDIKRENANINGDTAMGVMLKYGSESAKQFYDMYVLNPAHSAAHRGGDIHIHDLDFLTLTTTCCQIDLLKLFSGGFSTGHGSLREPKSISSYAALCCIAIQSNQNDQHGGQSIANFDYGMAPGVAKTFVKAYRENLSHALELLSEVEDADRVATELIERVQKETGMLPTLDEAPVFTEALFPHLSALTGDPTARRTLAFAQRRSVEQTDHATYKAMVALIHNLNTMHSRAGAQIPFSSINYGCDTSSEGRMVVRNLLLATEAGMGHGETPIFPIQIFRVKEGVNYNPGDPNYDLFRLALHTSAKRLFPNFSFLDASFNAQYYKGTPETEIAYMGCRTRVISNLHDPSKEIVTGRGNLSYTSINLPRIAIKAKGDIHAFFEELDRKITLVFDQLDERFEIQANRKVFNYPFLMGEGIWLDSDSLAHDEQVREVLKHGTLTIGFIGLAEALKSLTGAHHGESDISQNLGLEIIGQMRTRCDERSAKTRMNYTLIATPGEGLSGRFVKMDRARYGSIPGVTDREYYTNSFHVPVYHPISAYDKIRTEAPYHALTNAGHITYVELDGDPLQNLDAFERIIRAMHDEGIGYGSINHPIDRDPQCGYGGIIGDTCPGCGRAEKDGPGFERIRRITGYLVGTLNRFNNAKRAEELDRVKHGV
ncbi:MAG: anaerobic ribonucleoside triphosphate reductase [Clostridia bacterium]|nr:anaerobic ribonucleoside triphosphate reductase [Clostridia bacterium]